MSPSTSQGMIVQHPNGMKLLFVRHEERKKQKGSLWVGTMDGVVVTRWYAEGEEPPEAALVNDHAGRKEAELILLGFDTEKKESEARRKCLRYVVKHWLSDSQAKELREMYKKCLSKP